MAEKKGNWAWDVHEWTEKWEEEAKEWEKHQKKGPTVLQESAPGFVSLQGEGGDKANDAWKRSWFKKEGY